ncbi:MAG: MATE family efflux transporter [Ruminococcaceae bacterium]|nr:MATE family efflux transporter [Oscillospiraceae bacterium]
MRLKDADMDSPRLLKEIIIYSIPLIFINLIQNVFNSVDMVMLNAFDPSAVSSVGATSSIIHVLVNTFFGVATGVKVVLSHQMGAHDEKKVKSTVSTALITSFLMGIFLGIVGISLAKTFLIATKCPSDSFDGAFLYLRIYLLGVPAMMLYNFASAIITTAGDTRRPLYYMIISGGLNVVLNYILLLILPQKVMAVAISTTVSQAVGALLAVRRVFRLDGICGVKLRNMKWSFESFRKIMSNGLPIAFANGLLPLSNLQIQSSINELGSAVVAGTSAGSSIETIVSSLGPSAASGSVSVFVGYNLGARRYDRVKKSILYCLVLGIGMTAFATVVTLLLKNQIASLYVSEELAKQAAMVRMKTNVTFYVIACCNSVLSHTIQSFGYSVISTVNSILSVLVFRVFWMSFIYPPHRVLDAPIDSLFWICSCWPVSWMLLLIANVVITLYLYHRKLKKGKLRKLT